MCTSCTAGGLHTWALPGRVDQQYRSSQKDFRTYLLQPPIPPKMAVTSNCGMLVSPSSRVRLAYPMCVEKTCSHEAEHDIRGLCGVCFSCRLIYRDPRAEQQHRSGSPPSASGAGAGSFDQADTGEPDFEANPISAHAGRCGRGSGRAATAVANH